MSNKREIEKIAKEIRQIKAMLVKGYDRSFVKKIEKLTKSKFMGAEDTGVGQLYSFDLGDGGDFFEVEVSYESEDEYGEPQDDQTWYAGGREYYSERDFLKYVGKIAEDYRKWKH